MAAIVLRGLTVFSTGIVLEVALRLRRPDYKLDSLKHSSMSFSRTSTGPGVFFLGIELPNGFKIGTADLSSLGDGRQLHMELYRGSGNAMGRDVSWWVSPLPPPVRFDVVAEWPAYQVELGRHTLDGSAIRDAALRSLPLFA